MLVAGLTAPVSSAVRAEAATYPLTQLIPQSCLSDQAPDPVTHKIPPNKQCGLSEAVELAINVSRIILGVVGSATLLVFIYGGFLWLTSAGNSDQVQRGKRVFLGAIVGLAIVFGSTLIINFMVAALSGQDVGGTANVFNGEGAAKPVLQVPTTTAPTTSR